MDRPSFVTDEHLEFLDTLRKTGVTNMFGAHPYIMEVFEMKKQEAIQVLKYWMFDRSREPRVTVDVGEIIDSMEKVDEP